MRGNQVPRSPGKAITRSIPACAGEPKAYLRPCRGNEVYPRVCGGTYNMSIQRVDQQGLSPRVRGNLPPPGPHRARGRSIPACAGEPAPRRHPRRIRPVYPRVCGGTIYNPKTTQRDGGLSPRVRGNRINYFRRSFPPRSIPACAGEPVGRHRLGHGQKVYPRVCGGTRILPAAGDPQAGLSPRVRGNPVRPSCRSEVIRSIPACAGEPVGDPQGIARR